MRLGFGRYSAVAALQSLLDLERELGEDALPAVALPVTPPVWADAQDLPSGPPLGCDAAAEKLQATERRNGAGSGVEIPGSAGSSGPTTLERRASVGGSAGDVTGRLQVWTEADMLAPGWRVFRGGRSIWVSIRTCTSAPPARGGTPQCLACPSVRILGRRKLDGISHTSHVHTLCSVPGMDRAIGACVW